MQPAAPAADLAATDQQAPADPLGDRIAALYERVSAALIVVKITYESDDRERRELERPGIVIAPDGLIMFPASEGLLREPRSFLKKFEIVRPGRNEDPLPARLVSFDTIANVGFIAPGKSAGAWPHLDVAAGAAPPPLGRTVLGFGLLPEMAGRRCAFEVVRIGPQTGGDKLAVSPWPLLFSPIAVVDLEGRFIATLSSSSGFGFDNSPLLQLAAPVVASAAKYAIDHRRDRPEPWVGMAGLAAASPEIREFYEVPAGRGAIVVGYVVAKYPADKAGLKPKDLIIGADGQPLPLGANESETLSMFTQSLKRHDVGETLKLTVWRDGKEVPLTVTLGEIPLTPAKAQRTFVKDLGLAVRQVVFQDLFARKLPLDQPGAIVDRMVQSEPAETGGLEVGDIIRKVADASVDSVSDFERVIADALKRKPRELVMSVLRGQSEHVVVRIDLAYGRDDKKEKRPRAEKPAPQGPVKEDGG